MSDKKPAIFYGYIIAAAAFFIQFMAWGTNSSYGVFINPLSAEFGWSRATISGATTIMLMMYGIFCILAGWLNDRFGPRIVITCTGVILGAGYFLLSQIQSVGSLYLTFALVIALGLSGIDVVLLSTIARWFSKKRGIMSGFIKAGTGAGIATMPLIASLLIIGLDWRQAIAILGIAAGIVIVLMSQFLKRDPQAIQQYPDGKYEQNTVATIIQTKHFSLKKAMVTRQFWLLSFFFLLGNFSINSIMVHVVPHGIDKGIPTIDAAGVLSAIGIVSIIGRFSFGTIVDKYGIKKSMVACALLLMFSMGILFNATSMYIFFIFALVYGLSHGGIVTILSPAVAELFGISSHSTILGAITFIMMIGGSLGPVVTGYIFDVTGSYTIAFMAIMAMAVIAVILAILLRPTKSEYANPA